MRSVDLSNVSTRKAATPKDGAAAHTGFRQGRDDFLPGSQDFKRITHEKHLQ